MSSFRLAFCDFLGVSAAKPGYEMTNSVDIRYSHGLLDVPSKIFLTPVPALRMQRLESEFAVSNGTLSIKDGGLLHMEDRYRTRFTAFYCSRLVAQTPEEMAYVKDHYCEPLRTLRAQLTPEERDNLRTLSPLQCWVEKTSHMATIDPTLVEDFCGSAAR